MRELIFVSALVASAALSACATSESGGGQTLGRRIDWRCSGGAAFSARFTTRGAEVFAGGQTYQLPHVQAASGAKYASGAVEYWERGGGATLTGAHGGPYQNCRRG